MRPRYFALFFALFCARFALVLRFARIISAFTLLAVMPPTAIRVNAHNAFAVRLPQARTLTSDGLLKRLMRTTHSLCACRNPATICWTTLRRTWWALPSPKKDLRLRPRIFFQRGNGETFLANADSAGLVLGARIPIILTTRADSVRSRIASCAVAVLAAHARRQKRTQPSL
jgi:hypothetical protein